MSRKKIEDMFEIEGMDGFEDYDDFEEDDEEEGTSLEPEKGDVIELTGEDGEEKPFAVLDIIEYEHCIYMILMAADEDQDEDNQTGHTESVVQEVVQHHLSGRLDLFLDHDIHFFVAVAKQPCKK